MKRRDHLNAEERRPLNKQNLARLKSVFAYILPYKTSFLAGLFFLFCSSLTLMAFPFIAGKLIDAATGVIARPVYQIALSFIGILVIQSLFSFMRVFLFARVSENAMADLRQTLYQKYLELPMGFYDQHRTGELISRITADVSLLQDAFSTTLAELFRQFVILIVGTGIIFYVAPNLAVFMLATFPVVVVIAIFFGKYIRKLSRKTQDEIASANIVVEETLQSIFMVKAFTGELFENSRYRKGLDRVIRMALNAAVYRGAFISFAILALFGGIVAVMWYGAVLVQGGLMSVGDLLSFILYTTFIGGSIAGLGDLYGQVQKAIGASERILEITNMKGEYALHTPKLLALKGDISFDEVSFAYPSRPEVKVLSQVSFQVKAGECIALVGQSGAGKSTIAQLLLQFYSCSEGSITVDGKPIDQYDLVGYRQNVGIVPQEVSLFGGTIRENIRYGRPDASDEEVMLAARKAQVLQFISSFPDGLETVVGERGVKLSGGQRQRIAIARAILKDPVILILDEATNALDAESESLVQRALDELMADRTTLIIAHRLATIKRADKIMVLQDGNIVESGNHLSLLQSDGIYANLVKLQLADD
jgi:ATP-binding cassette, subfamily B, bacterial